MNSKGDPFVARAFQAEDQQAAKHLILDGLREHWGELDRSLNQDLNDIAASYPAGFFVAFDGDTLIGTGGLTQIDESTFQIVRMSVAREQRRQGVGGLILTRLIQHARGLGAQEIILETTQNWLDARAFYEKAGFVFSHIDGDDAYYRLEL